MVDVRLETINQEIEPLRKQVIKNYGIAFGVLFLALIGFRVYSLSIPIVIVFFVLFVKASKSEKNYKQTVKQLIADKIFTQIFTVESFDPEFGFDKDFIKQTELVDMGNEFHSNDLLEGRYHNVHFMRSDLHLVRVTNNGKTTTRTTLFKGQWIVFDFFKDFNSYLQIRDKEDRFFGRNRKPTKFFSSRPSSYRIQLDHPEFNEIFDCYASDDHEAFYLLTPHFMDALIKLNDHIEAELVLGFIDNKLHVALNTHEDAFEPSIYSALTQAKINQIVRDANLIVEIIDILKLTTDLYK